MQVMYSTDESFKSIVGVGSSYALPDSDFTSSAACGRSISSRGRTAERIDWSLSISDQVAARRGLPILGLLEAVPLDDSEPGIRLVLTEQGDAVDRERFEADCRKAIPQHLLNGLASLRVEPTR